MSAENNANGNFWAIAQEEDKKLLNPVDSHVRVLVMGANGIGIETIGSCEGHLGGHRYPYPWVTIASFGRETSYYEEVLAQFNEGQDVAWEFSNINPYITHFDQLTPSEEALGRFGITPEIAKEFRGYREKKGDPITKGQLWLLQLSARNLGVYFSTIHMANLKDAGVDPIEIRHLYLKAWQS